MGRKVEREMGRVTRKEMGREMKRRSVGTRPPLGQWEGEISAVCVAIIYGAVRTEVWGKRRVGAEGGWREGATRRRALEVEERTKSVASATRKVRQTNGRRGRRRRGKRGYVREGTWRPYARFELRTGGGRR